MRMHLKAIRKQANQRNRPFGKTGHTRPLTVACRNRLARDPPATFRPAGRLASAHETCPPFGQLSVVCVTCPGESTEASVKFNCFTPAAFLATPPLPRVQLQITREALRQFLELEQQIHELERRRVLDNYLLRTEQLEKLETGLEQMKANKYRCLDDL